MKKEFKLLPEFVENIEYIVTTSILNVPSQNWAKIQLVAHLLGDAEGCFLDANYWQKGKIYAIDYDPNSEEDVEEDDYYDLLNIFQTIKGIMFENDTEKGGWFTATLNIYPDNSFDYNFDYEELPELCEDAQDDDYIQEWEDYPRKLKYTPDWLIEILERNGIEVKD